MNDLVIISGPTAVGKSKAAIELSEIIGGSVISADSMQVYRGMDIGTAKLTKEEMGDIPHYLIDVLDPSEDFNIVTFNRMAKDAVDKIYSNGRIPVIAGGTGFYIHSLLYDADFDDAEELASYRQYLYDLIADRGEAYVHDMLKEADPDAALKIHPNDHKRVIRALEYNRQTGGRISEHNMSNSVKESPYNFCYFILTDDREAIYDRIDRRVDDMMRAGLVDEVRSLLSKGLTRHNVSMHGLGYKEIIDHLEGRISLERAVTLIKQGSRHYAKRQLTWAKREKDAIIIDISKDDVIRVMTDELQKKGIINGHDPYV